jgi:hypothetical protein
MPRMHVFFFRGLSTYGNDVAKWSIFNFGPLAKNFSRAFAQRDVAFYPVLGMGVGSLEEICIRARRFIEEHPVWRDPESRVHLLGHSAGGLVARLLLPQLELSQSGKILSLMTVATPHQGAELAQIFVDMPERYRGSALLFRSFGYDIHAKRDFFREFTPATIRDTFAAQTALLPRSTATLGSVVCTAPSQDWCLPLRLFHKVQAFRDFTTPSDGVVERDTQPFGEVRAEIQLDHFRQVGFFGGEARFEQMCDVIAEFFKDSDSFS